jgi:uncharacterized RDD family membrane protein YckC
MSWFYANAGKQMGPVTRAEFDHLTREGVILPATLVWREGMIQWEPWEKVAATFSSAPEAKTDPTTPATPPAGQIVCTECRRLTPAEETMQVGGAIICSACKPIFVQKLREGAHVEPQVLHYAGFWIRVAAYVIDQVILTLVTLPLSLWFNTRMDRALQPALLDWGQFFQYLGLSMAWSTVIAVSYGCFFVGRYAATPGKMIVKLKIVTGDGGRVSYLRALARQGGHVVSGMTCLIGYLLPLFDDQKRALHDHICNTRVIYKK